MKHKIEEEEKEPIEEETENEVVVVVAAERNRRSNHPRKKRKKKKSKKQKIFGLKLSISSIFFTYLRQQKLEERYQKIQKKQEEKLMEQ